jgi:hypothetical protein
MYAKFTHGTSVCLLFDFKRFSVYALYTLDANIIYIPEAFSFVIFEGLRRNDSKSCIVTQGLVVLGRIVLVPGT